MSDIVAGVGLGYRKRDLEFAAYDLRQITALLFLAAVADQRADAEDRQMHRAGRVHRAAGTGDLAHHQRGLGKAETASAVLFRNRDAQVSAFGERLVEIVRELVPFVLVAPILVGKAGA